MTELVEIPQDDLDSLIIEETFTIGKFSQIVRPISWVRKKGFGWAFHKTIKSVMDSKDDLIESLPKIFEKLMSDYPVIMEISTGIGRKSLEKLQLPEQVELIEKVIKVNRLADDAFKKKCISLVKMFKAEEEDQVEAVPPTIDQIIKSGVG